MTWIHAVIDVPDATASIAADFWSAVLGWPLGEPWPRHPELRSFEPPGGDAYVHHPDAAGTRCATPPAWRSA